MGINPYGGALKNANYGRCTTVRDCVFKCNSAGDGGGIENWSNSHLRAINCLFIGNIAGSYGCGLDNDAAGLEGNQVDLVNCTFYDNDGDAVTTKMNGVTQITNCLLAGGDAIYGTGNAIAYTAAEQFYPGQGNLLVANPVFFNAAGGDFHLQTSSPCLDHGTVGPDVPDHDIGGRPRDLVPDLGAYECVCIPLRAVHLRVQTSASACPAVDIRVDAGPTLTTSDGRWAVFKPLTRLLPHWFTFTGSPSGSG